MRQHEDDGELLEYIKKRLMNTLDGMTTSLTTNTASNATTAIDPSAAPARPAASAVSVQDSSMSASSGSTQASTVPANLTAVSSTLSRKTKNLMIVVLFASNILASLMQSLMNVALDNVAITFHITLSQANWMVLAYTIVTATVITMAASLLKRYGLRIVFFVGYIFAFVGSLVGFFAVNYPMMIAARLLQAVTTGLYFPLINEALLMLAPAGQAAKLLTINSGVIGCGLAFAPPISGLIITYIGLRALFLVPAFMAIVLAIAGHFMLYDLYPRAHRHIDILSLFLSFSGLACFMYGLNELPHGVFPQIFIMFGGIAIFGLFLWRQTQLKEPLLDLHPLKTRIFSVGEVLIMLVNMVLMSLSLLLPLYFEGVNGMTTFIAGCLCIGPIICYAIACPFSGKALNKRGVMPLILMGLVAMLAGLVIIFFAAHVDNLFVIIAGACLVLIGIGMIYPAIKTVNLEALPPVYSSDGSAVHSTDIQLANSLSSALFIGLLSGGVDGRVAEGVSRAHAYLTAFPDTLLVAVGIALGALVLSFVYAHLVKKSNMH